MSMWKLFFPDGLSILVAIIVLVTIFLYVRPKLAKMNVFVGKWLTLIIVIIVAIFALMHWKDVAILTVPKGEINKKSLKTHINTREDNILRKVKSIESSKKEN